jgi:hypothetical protein
MNTKPHVSQEADRRAYQAQQNISGIARYRQQREQLEALKLQLSQAVMAAHPQATCERIEAAIISGHRQLECGKELADAVTHSSALLEEVLA